MQEFKEISIHDSDLFKGHIEQDNYKASELSFTNFFMWRNFYKFRYIEYEDMLCILSVQDDKDPFAFIPIGKPDREKFRKAILFIKDYFVDKGWKLVFKRIEEDKVSYFTGYSDIDTEVVFERESSDYVYLVDDLVNLKGKKFHAKRNHINSFINSYEYEYVNLSKEYISECVRINEEWCEIKGCESHIGMFCEKIANNEVLSNYEKLGLKGALIKVNGRFESYTVGEALNEDTVVIHIEKANDNIRGLYPLINQQFCKHQWKDYMYINREQDLGIEGLRKAKMSYNPVMMINKYIVYIK